MKIFPKFVCRESIQPYQTSSEVISKIINSGKILTPILNLNFQSILVKWVKIMVVASCKHLLGATTC